MNTEPSELFFLKNLLISLQTLPPPGMLLARGYGLYQLGEAALRGNFLLAFR